MFRLREKKTKMVYCQDYQRLKRKDNGSKIDFPRGTFKPKTKISKKESLFLRYGNSISQKSQSTIADGWEPLTFHRLSELKMQDIANQLSLPLRLKCLFLLDQKRNSSPITHLSSPAANCDRITASGKVTDLGLKCESIQGMNFILFFSGASTLYIYSLGDHIFTKVVLPTTLLSVLLTTCII